MPEHTSFRYPATVESPEFIVGYIAVDDVTENVAHGALRLLTDAYENQFEDGLRYDKPLPRGAVRDHFRPELDFNVALMRDRMINNIRAGSAYLRLDAYTTDNTDTDRIAGIVKVSPSKAGAFQKVGLQKPNLFINDILVDPDLQDASAGVTLWHAGVALTGYVQSKKVALHAFPGSKLATGNATTDWFESYGMEERPSTKVDPVRIGTHLLPQVLMVSKDGMTVGSITRQIEARHPVMNDVQAMGTDGEWQS